MISDELARLALLNVAAYICLCGPAVFRLVLFLDRRFRRDALEADAIVARIYYRLAVVYFILAISGRF